MYKGLISCYALGLLLTSCSRVNPHISVVCEENNVGNCIVKWETAPAIEGDVKVYASNDPENIPEVTPVATAPISSQRMTVVTNNPAQRYYYSLVFNRKYRVRTATRNVIIPGIQNFRDLGGYPAYITHRRTRWGMLYRSGAIENLDGSAIQELKNIGIKTIVDLRTAPETSQRQADLQQSFNLVNIPIMAGSMEETLKGIEDRSIRSDTVYRIVERMNRQLISQHTHEFRQVFDVLLNEDNYPIVIHCTTGKGRTGIMSALILASLGINEELIMDDYRLSNDYFNIPAASRYAYQLPARSQEAITTMFSAREEFLNAAREEAERTYGDIDTYLRKGVGLSKKEMKKLQEILTVKED